MKGVVQGISANRVFCAVLTDLGYTIFEVHDGDVSMGDIIVGDLNSHGSVVLRNESQGNAIDAYVQAIQATREAARSLLQSH